jgi:hypothetical protein
VNGPKTKNSFIVGEIVRVERMVGWPAGTPDVVGQQGRVETFHPRPPAEPSGRAGWEVCVWLYALEEVWCFDEDELASTGTVELIDVEGSRRIRREQAGSTTEPPSVTARLFLAPEAPGDVAARVERRLHELGTLAKVVSTTARNDDWACEVVEVLVWPEDEAADYFERLVDQGRDDGWIRRFDDGWSCDFWWSRSSSTSGSFLVAEVNQAAVSLTPWANPTRRPVPPNRTTGPGLPLA